MSHATLQLGPFFLQRPIGKGGMGEVWRGLHAPQRAPVAIKVMTVERSRDPHYRLYFEREIQSAAALEHPGIITLLDHGEVSPEAERASGGRLTSGSPYLVMELADQGTLQQLQTPVPWPHLRRILLDVLSALAHAHARGVIHRDLKPANVLFVGAPTGAATLKLSDFGIAATTVDGANVAEFSGGTAGTPGYMAPEQLQGLWREHAPWTDLYAVGCIAYELACGAPPFHQGDIFDVIDAHLHAPIPEVRSQQPVPRAFSAWVRRLLQKTPHDRFVCAADAAAALRALPGQLPQHLSPSQGTPALTLVQRATRVDAPPTPSTLDEPARTLQALHLERPTRAEAISAEAPTIPSAEWIAEALSAPAPRLERASLPPRRPPALPERWTSPRRRARPAQLLGAGLGLYGLRSIPFVNREAERALLWSELTRVHREGLARAVVLEGAAGLGKSRLARALTEHAHEVGGAIVLKATHSPFASPADGLPRMLAAHLNALGLGHAEVLERCRRELARRALSSDDDVLSDSLLLTELMMPSVALTPRSVQRLSLDDVDAARREPVEEPSLRRRARQPERHQALARLLDRLTRERPVILHIDDARWGREALAFARYLMQNREREPIPALLLLTASSDAADKRPVESALLRELLQHPATTRVELAPLDEPAHAQLVERLLGLEGDLAAEVEARTSGNPLFAVQLVGDWVQRGLLIPSEGGFRLREGARLELPDDIHQLWLRRIERIEERAWIEATPAQIRRALELAAALGSDVDLEEWRAACAIDHLPIPRGLIPALISSRLATAHATGWAFAHAMLHESLERSAREHGRWRDHHLTCVAMLRQTYGDDQPGLQSRVAEHLLAAGALEPALEPLLGAAEECGRLSDFAQAHALFQRREDTLDALHFPADHGERARGWALQASHLATQGELARAAQRVGLAAQTRPSDPSLLASLSMTRGNIARKRGELGEGLRHFEAARAEFEALDDALGVARCDNLMGEVCHALGRLESSEAHTRAALAGFQRAGDRVGQGHCLTNLANTRRQLGDVDAAQEMTARALSRFQEAGHRLGIASSLNNLGEMARFDGRLDEAERLYRRAIEAAHGIHALEATLFQVNLGILLLTRRSWAEARAQLEDALSELEAGEGRSVFAGFVHAELLPCCAHDADWGAWSQHLDAARACLEGTGVADPDIAEPVQLAGDIAQAAGHPRRAHEAWAFAAEQWRSLGRIDDAAALEGRLAPAPPAGSAGILDT